MARDLYYGDDARNGLQAGMDQLTDAVKTTIGPRGRNVLVNGPSGKPILTNEGSGVTRDFELSDITENLGAQMLKEVATKMNDAVGDGTTTALLLMQPIIREGIKNMAAGANPMGIRRGIQGAVDVAVKSISGNAYKLENKKDIVQVAAISGADEQAGEMIGEIMEQVGRDGVITIEESKTMETTYRIVKGSQFDKGYLSEHMVSDTEKMEAVLEHPYILFTDKKISDMRDVIPILDQVAQRNRKLLIVAEDVEGEALKALIINKLQGAIDVVAVRAPGFGERKKALVDELALLTGATVVRAETGYDLSKATVEMLGEAEKVTVMKDRTVLVGGAGDKAAIAEEIEKLRGMLAAAKDEFAADRARERLGKLAGGVAVISVGAASELEMKDKKARIEDALNAVRAALDEGIVAGGGVALCGAIPAVQAYAAQLEGDERVGAQLIARALDEPIKQIAENAGYDGNVVAAEAIKKGNGIGFDVLTGQYVTMRDAGIVDPAKVARVALQHAASMASTFLTVEANVIDPIDEAWLRAKMAGQPTRR
ncbi:chaperonin GroEL [Butyricicoccus sp. Marseille-Q5471]|uniref:chaperonin GroEL n=1 Tax=Butyricicoccus sp. Marseille-Q5471 TaxID=3039493 RepID=UPI0024BD16DF|nr:chaperonin GroEL [Butyricicoccus sp. Marseille-Q5471]